MTPIFIHVGILHLLINMLAQVLVGAQVEREMGTVPFLIVYLAGGVYGFVLGGNFLRVGIPSAGASGALFAIVGYTSSLHRACRLTRPEWVRAGRSATSLEIRGTAQA